MNTYTITATPEARQRLESYFNEIVDRRQAGELADVSQYASRWCEQAARLAITLHAGLHGATAHQHQLALETAENAVTLATWFADQQLGLLAKGRIQAAAKVQDEVLKLLENNRVRKGQDYITVREVHRARITAAADAAKALLARMAADGLLVGEDITPAHPKPRAGMNQHEKNKMIMLSLRPFTIIGTDPHLDWEMLLDYEPQLAHLLRDAITADSDRNAERFCRQTFLQKELRPLLSGLVGHRRTAGQHSILGTFDAYAVAYQKLMNAVPPCRGRMSVV